MNIKLILTLGAIILFLVVAVGAYVFITRTTETYKAKEQYYHTNEPHFGFLSFGCASFRVEQEKAEKVKKPEIKK